MSPKETLEAATRSLSPVPVPQALRTPNARPASRTSLPRDQALASILDAFESSGLTLRDLLAGMSPGERGSPGNLGHLLAARSAPEDFAVIRMPQVQELCPLSKPSIYRLISAGKFPAPFSLGGGRAVCWLRSEVEDYMRQRIGGREKSDMHVIGLQRKTKGRPPKGGRVAVTAAQEPEIHG